MNERYKMIPLDIDERLEIQYVDDGSTGSKGEKISLGPDQEWKIKIARDCFWNTSDVFNINVDRDI